MTPIRRQYLKIKRRYPHANVFFRLGDFYETFDDDAKLVAHELEITLTTKPMGNGQRVPLAGVLATLQFTTLLIGTTDLTLSGVTAVMSDGTSYNTNVTNGDVTIR